MPDPRFPNRPTHPDFAILATVLTDQDRRADGGEDFPSLVGSIIDVPSVEYVAQQQVGMMLERLGGKLVYSSREVEQLLQSVFMAAVTVGIRFQQLREESGS